MNANLNHDQIAMIIERARNERGIAVGRLIATSLHTLLDWLVTSPKNARQARPMKRTEYHLSSEGAQANHFDTSAFV